MQGNNPSKVARATNRKRTNASCDLCKGRKTKVNHVFFNTITALLLTKTLSFPSALIQVRSPLYLCFYLIVLESNGGCAIKVPGPCKYCASISAPCTISVRRKQRPFYSVSEEEYRYGIEILQKFFPDTDLNLNTLRGIAQKVDQLPTAPGVSTQTNVPPVVQLPSECEDDESAQAFDSCHDSVQTNLQYADTEETQPPSNTRDIPTDDNNGPPVQPITKENGYMFIDPAGTTSKQICFCILRASCNVCSTADSMAGYVGPRSDLLFISAVRSRAKGEAHRPETEGLHIPRGFSPPIDLRCALTRNYSSHLAYLPPRQDWDCHVERFFREINSTYWLVSMETLWSRLDSTYKISTPKLSASWICFLYALMALTSQSSQPNNASPDNSSLNVDPSGPNLGLLTSSDYISLARSLVDAVMEEADIDSVRALSAMVSFKTMPILDKLCLFHIICTSSLRSNILSPFL